MVRHFFALWFLLVTTATAFVGTPPISAKRGFHVRSQHQRLLEPVRLGNGGNLVAVPRQFLRRRLAPLAPLARWLGRLAALAVSVIPTGALAAIVDRTVVEAAEAARLMARPGGLKDRIITDHIELITSALLEKQRAQYLAMRNMIVGIIGVCAVFGVFATISTARAAEKFREQEIEIFGEVRDGLTEMIEEEDEEDEEFEGPEGKDQDKKEPDGPPGKAPPPPDNPAS